jgi:hypothetical protein
MAAEYEAPLKDEREFIFVAALYFIWILRAGGKGTNALDGLPFFQTLYRGRPIIGLLFTQER